MKKVLVIEDDVPLSWLIERILSKKFDVVTKNNGIDAWCWLEDGNVPNLIISDLKMPNLDGVELLENLANSGYLEKSRVMILSGNEDPEKRSLCMALGAVAYVVKPFEPESFIEQVERALISDNTPKPKVV